MTDESFGRLTRRQEECLRLVLELRTNDAIARRLDVSVNTVRNHVKAARDKLGGAGRYEAARRYALFTNRMTQVDQTSGGILQLPSGSPDHPETKARDAS